MIFSSLLVVAFLIAVNALFVAAELGIVAVRLGQVRERAEHGQWLATRLLPLLEEPAELDRAISACQVGITVSGLALGAFGEAVLAPLVAPALSRLGGLSPQAALPVASVVVLLFLTVVQMLLGELVPKTVALEHPLPTALATAVPLSWTRRLLSPFIYLFNGSAVLLLRLVGIRASRHRHVHSARELDLLLGQSEPIGELDRDERRRLRRALALSARRARDLMVPRSQIAALDLATPTAEVLRFVADTPYTRFPVIRGSLDQVAGVLHTKDVALRQLEQGGAPTTIEDLVRPLATVPETAGADRVLALLREQRAQMALVLGAGGTAVGLITLEDVLSHILGAEVREARGPARPGEVRGPARPGEVRGPARPGEVRGPARPGEPRGPEPSRGGRRREP